RPRDGAGIGDSGEQSLLDVTDRKVVGGIRKNGMAKEKRGLLEHVVSIFRPIDEIGGINENSVQVGIPVQIQEKGIGDHRPPEPAAVLTIQKEIGPIRDDLQIRSSLVCTTQEGEKSSSPGEV